MWRRRAYAACGREMRDDALREAYMRRLQRGSMCGKMRVSLRLRVCHVRSVAARFASQRMRRQSHINARDDAARQHCMILYASPKSGARENAYACNVTRGNAYVRNMPCAPGDCRCREKITQAPVSVPGRRYVSCVRRVAQNGTKTPPLAMLAVPQPRQRQASACS